MRYEKSIGLILCLVLLATNIAYACYQIPVAIFADHEVHIQVGNTADFDASPSFDPDETSNTPNGNANGITKFEWLFDYEDGDPWTTPDTTENGPNPTGLATSSSAYTSVGVYTAAVRVTDDDDPANQGGVGVSVPAMCKVYVRPADDIIYVPGTVETIQEAIDMAVDGCTIIVGPKVYSENVEFKGKNITLRSSDPSNWEVVHATVISGTPGNGSTTAVSFDGSEGSGQEPCKLQGFTIEGGGMIDDPGAHWTFEDVAVNNTTDDITGNGNIGTVHGAQLESGRVGNSLSFDGTDDYVDVEEATLPASGPFTISLWVYAEVNYTGQMLVHYNVSSTARFTIGTSGSSRLLIRDASGNHFSHCPLADLQWWHLAVVFDTDGNLQGVYRNGAFTPNNYGEPGYTEGSYGITSPLTTFGKRTYETSSLYFDGRLDDIRIYPRALSEEEIKMLAARNGGGISGNGALVEISNCVISGNTAFDGGGINDCNGQISSCVVYDNLAFGWGGGLAKCDGQILNTVVANNAAFAGAGCWTDGGTLLTNCTFANNLAYGEGGGLYVDGGIATIENCIMWGNVDASCSDTGATAQIAVNSGTTTVNYSCIQDGWIGGGSNNIDDNPLFADLERPAGIDAVFGTSDDGLKLRARTSTGTVNPSIDSGDDSAVSGVATDVCGQVRVMDGDNSDAATVDRGVYELPRIWYVDAEVAGLPANEDGKTWHNAFRTLQGALAQAADGDEIWVAADEDKPYVPTEVSQSFVINKKVSIYGGFGGEDANPAETAREQRNWKTNETVLSGDVDAGSEDRADMETGLPRGENSYHVVTIQSGADGAILDGFTIRGGKARDSQGNGGGIYCSSASPTICNCFITLNMATDHGGAIYVSNGASPRVVNCVLAGNWANDNGGGVYLGSGCGLDLINCTVHANKALGEGGGLYCDQSSVSMANCIFWGNLDGPDVVDESSQISLNSATALVDYCVVDGWTGALDAEGTGNSGNNPEFKAEGQWEMRLANEEESLIEAGDTPTVFYTTSDKEVIIYDFLSGKASMNKGMTGVIENEFVGEYLHFNDTGAYNYKTPTWDPSDGPTNTVSSFNDFDAWFTTVGFDGKGPHISKEVPWTCRDATKGIFRFDQEHFFPIDSNGFGNEIFHGSDCCDESFGCNKEHNWFFTFQYHGTYTYVPDQKLFFKASDDLIVAINNRVVVDRCGYFNTNAEGRGPSHTTVWLKNGYAYIYVWDYDAENPPPEDPYDVEGLQPTVIDCNIISHDTSPKMPMEPFATYDFDLFFAQRKTDRSVLIAERTPGQDEVLVSFAPGIYKLNPPSPCIDTGNSPILSGLPGVDLDCTARKQGDEIDMGAYEYNSIVVDAGPDQTITLPDNDVVLDGRLVEGDPTYATFQWDAVTCPPNGTVSFTDNTSLNTTATFDEPGFYTLRLTGSDGYRGATDEVVIKVSAQNLAPVVDAGADYEITWPTNWIDLTGAVTVTDDSLPDPPAALALSWSKVDGPGIVWFHYEDEEEPYVGFSSEGVYTIRLTADDGELTGYDDIQVTINPQPNLAPVITMPDNTTIQLPSGVELDATVSDDGLPDPPAALTVTWSKQSGPGMVTFANANSIDTIATFSIDGTYTLRLTASDGAEEVCGEVVITVNPENQPPIVDAGEDQTIEYPQLTTDLDGTISDDGQLQPLTVTWSQISGPAGVTFGDAHAVDTTATFPTDAAYGLQLEAYDGQHTVPDLVMIDVQGPPLSHVLEAEAGADKVVSLSENGQVTIPLADATFIGGDPSTPKSFIWSVVNYPLTGTLEGFIPHNLELNPEVILGVNPDVFQVEDSVKFDLKLEVFEDGGGYDDDYVSVTVTPGTDESSQSGPQVRITAADSIQLPATLDLTGVIKDDAMPFGFLTGAWSLVSCDTMGTVEFTEQYFMFSTAKGDRIDTDDGITVTTTATFSKEGTYVIALAASDGQKEDTALAAVQVDPDPGAVIMPTVEAGNYAPIPVGTWLPRDGEVTPAGTDIVWSIEPSAGADIYDETSLAGLVYFTEPGEYTLTLTSVQYPEISDDATIFVNPVDPLPSAYAGSDKTRVLEPSGTVVVDFDDAVVTERALPIGDRLIEWSCPSTEGYEFLNSSESEEQPSVRFTLGGTYEFTLKVTDAGYWAEDIVYVTIDVPTAGAERIIYAGGSCPGYIYRLSESASDWVIDTPTELGNAVLCLCEYDDQIYAGTTTGVWSGTGRVWRRRGPASWEQVGGDLNNAVFDLVVYNDVVYAATGTNGAILYRYEPYSAYGAWTEVGAGPGFRALNAAYVCDSREAIALGSIATDWFAHYKDDAEGFVVDGCFAGSCIWDIASYQDKLYAGAYGPRLYYSDETGFNWGGGETGNLVPGLPADLARNLWELEAFDGYLYLGSDKGLARYDGSTFSVNSTIGWTHPLPSSITSMIVSTGLDTLYIGTGQRYYSETVSEGLGEVYSYDGLIQQCISPGMDMGRGIQSLLEVGGLPCPEYFTVNMTTDIEADGDPANDALLVHPDDQTRDEIGYDIEFDAHAQPNAKNVRIIQHFPLSLEFDSVLENTVVGSSCVYDAQSHSLTWFLGDVQPGATGNLKVKVKVTELATPGGHIWNQCELVSSNFATSQIVDTSVDWWTDNEIIYVDADVMYGNGLSWETAYRSLTHALQQVEVKMNDGVPDNEPTQIWVAGGTYVTDGTLVMQDGVDIYGGFSGEEGSVDQRRLDNPENVSVLDGRNLVQSVVVVANARLDGFTVRGGTAAGIYGHDPSDPEAKGCSPTISNCIIELNKRGIYINCSN